MQQCRPVDTSDSTLARVARQFSTWAASSPAFAARYARFNGELAQLWIATLARERGEQVVPLVPPDPTDRRFASKSWQASPFYDYLRQSYLLGVRFLNEVVEQADLSPHEKGLLRFLTRQYVDAIAPTNFAATNPEVIALAIASRGETLARGVRNLVADLEKQRISTVDEAAFEVGRNLATTEGAVVFENELMQLIEYRPSTAKVFARPLLMVPPCINKFYVLDLQPANSFVRYAVAQGHSVFMVSWRNPDAAQGSLGWDDYIEDGVLRAIRVAREITKSAALNVLGFCVGGTLAATALAVLAARGERSVASLTLLATLLDFEDAGEIGHFVDTQSVAAREAALGAGGILPGRELGLVFSALRDNDLIWSYVVGNYLKGDAPAAFDILYWNADSTNLPGPMYCWYLRNMYLENRLRESGALTVCGESVDLGRLAMPAYVLATREDHIVPWQSAFRACDLLGGETRLVLGASGHIAGVINPPAAGKRSFRTGPRAKSPDAWFAQARETPGSWWDDWSAWIGASAGARVNARRTLGNRKYRSIEPAPGRYVKQRIA